MLRESPLSRSISFYICAMKLDFRPPQLIPLVGSRSDRAVVADADDLAHHGNQGYRPHHVGVAGEGESRASPVLASQVPAVRGDRATPAPPPGCPANGP